MLIRDQHRLILWSVREGELLQEAVDWCKERGVEFWAVNKDYPEESYETTIISHVSSRLITSLMTVTLAVYPTGDRFIR